MNELFPPPKQHNPGGKRTIRLPPSVISDASFGGPANCYRYRLIRIWNPGTPARVPLFVMMNPSTATMEFDDPTVAKISRMARAWGCTGLAVGNVFAYRATDQKRLAEVDDPIGPDNDAYLLDMARGAERIIMAYGTPASPALRGRGPAVARMLAAAGLPLHVLQLSPKGGVPMHPLYLPESLQPQPWTPAAA